MYIKIISGGQTGVDRAALDFAMAHGMPVGGWCPKGRKADDGPIEAHYPLRETPRSEYRQRTFWNMRDCDGALIFYRGELTGGTLLTVQLARSMKKVHRLVHLNRNADLEEMRTWLYGQRIRILNVAGPRERGNRGIYSQTVAFLDALFGGREVWIPLEVISVAEPPLPHCDQDRCG
ncbi:MAG: molybdenum cofactor carrier [Magnetococcales bacterium]|nr:putative molybdenum carrier protein [Magnetococcales bacterium]NGZ04887.1 molybdenum cofactor carrier [Magnetococcales bacterium]